MWNHNKAHPKKKVLLIYPNVTMTMLLPVNIPIISAILKTGRFEVELFDTTFYDNGLDNFEKQKEHLLQVKPFALPTMLKPKQEMYADLSRMVNDYKPDVIAFTVVEDTIELALALLHHLEAYVRDSVPVVFGGVGATFNSDRLAKDPLVDVIVKGESERIIPTVFKYAKKHRKAKVVWDTKGLTDLDKLPLPDYSIFPNERIVRVIQGVKHRMLQVEVDRGCPFTCFTGDTPVNTLEGSIPIKELAGRNDVKVLTYDPDQERILYTPARNIRMTRRGQKIVRVHFDDGSHIDCTPDHVFKRFLNRNQFVDVREFDTEAKDLNPKDSVRAVKYSPDINGYIEIAWRRRKRVKEHRLKMECVLGRRLLSRGELVHHIDRDKGNNALDNLVYVKSHKEHLELYHPEISERMRTNNPAFNYTQEWKDNLRDSITGIKRALSTRLKHRRNKLGENNPNYRDGSRTGTKSRINNFEQIRKRRLEKKETTDPNHKVVRVEHLKVLQDVYCMEVPKYHWFYANNVLVHNCRYCCAPALRKFHMHRGKYYRQKSSARIMWEMRELKRLYQPTYFDFNSETFIMRKYASMKKLMDEYAEFIQLPFWCQTRPETVTEVNLQLLKSGGISDLQFGVEHGNEDFRKNYLMRQGGNDLIREKLLLVEKYGIPYTVNMIMGFAQETREMVWDSINILRGLNPKTINVYKAVAYRGTRMHEDYLANDLIDDRSSKPNTLLGGSRGLKRMYMTDEEVDGLQRCFPLYARMPEIYHPQIKRAERFDPIGNREYAELSAMFTRQFYS